MRFLGFLFTVLVYILSSINSQAQNFGGGLITGVSTSQVAGDMLGGFNKIGFIFGVYTDLRVKENMSLQYEITYIEKGSKNPDIHSAEKLGRLVAQLQSLRQMSISVAGMLSAGREPVLEASIVKDVGTNWEQELPNAARDIWSLLGPNEGLTNASSFEELVQEAVIMSPKYTIQGGTREILRGIIARGLGVR